MNPHHYGDTFRGKPSAGDTISHAKAIVDEAVRLGIDVLAVTDHNSVNSIPAFRSAAQDRGVRVFPGFELSSTEGVHVLCLYPLDESTDRLERYLGGFGINNTEPSSDLANAPFVEILTRVRSQRGIPIAAHVTNKGGLFEVLDGQARVRAWKDGNLLAAQIPGTVEDLPHNIRQIVKNRNADYRRDHAPEHGLSIAAVNARDVFKPEGLDHRAATCWIKMHEVSIGGLGQAFLDPGSRIRLNSKDGEFQPEEHAELLSLGWEGGFLDGVSVRLNPNLNVLIGGRGTGKSTIVESIRSVLGLTPIGDEARKAHDGIVRHVLRSGTKISLRIRVRRPSVRDYRIERTIPNPPLVREASGEVLHLTPKDILPRIEAYGQHEISELARRPEKLTRLLDRFVERDQSLSRRKVSLRGELAKNRRALCDTCASLREIEERLATLPRLEETLKRFQEAGLEERLREQAHLVREERVLDSISDRLTPFREALDLLQQELPIDLTFLSERALADLPGRDILSRSNETLTDFGEKVRRICHELMRALEDADQETRQVRAAWDVRRRQVQTDYEQILRELQKSRVDGEEFIRLRREIERLRPLQDRLVVLQQLENEHVDRRYTLLAEWEDLKASEFRTLDQAARKVSRKLRKHVRVEVTSSGNREPLFKMLRGEIGGRLSEAIEVLKCLPQFSLTQFAEACRSGATALRTTYGITPVQAKRLAEAEPEVIMKIEELEISPTTAIQLNTAPVGKAPAWQPLEDLSTGQKATAVLLLLLLESGAPLIVDQPEDDLDNRFITDGVVPRIRKEKQRRQFIFSTHNANIPVLGDAELILGLAAAGAADGGQARIVPEHVGSIDSRSVRELVEEILEGGRDAFETRRRKYGF
ncbi:MAG: AAA family ATPase [Bryobacterales bacterium]|nr:AAA family ATPase [Bryobacterales bacterium]